MIDEELYQQAADELNSDRRRPHIWARACALASDDHDEARYLYTNLRVEELIAERESSDPSPVVAPQTTQAEVQDTPPLALALEPITIDDDDSVDLGVDVDVDVGDDVDVDVDDDGLLASLDAEALSLDTQDVTPKSFSAPSGVDGPGTSDDLLQLLADEKNKEDAIASEGAGFEARMERHFEQQAAFNATEPESELPSDGDGIDASTLQAPEPDSDLSPDGDGIDASTIDDKSLEEDFLDSYAEHQENIKAAAREQSPEELINKLEMSDTDVSDDQHSGTAHDELQFDFDSATALDPDPDEIAIAYGSDQNAVAAIHGDHTADDSSQIEANEQARNDDSLSWLDDDSSISLPATQHGQPSSPREQENDRLAQELERQADQLPGQHSDVIEHTDLAHEDQIAAYAASDEIPETPDLAPPHESGIGNQIDEQTYLLPVDLTLGQSGKEFAIYKRYDDKIQAVGTGVSWSALFFTLPFLIYRQLFGTAILYSLLWIIVLGGLLLNGLAWMDAGSSATILIKASTIGFALLAIVGLLYIPFRYGNTWRGEKLERRDFELVAWVRASTPGKAVVKARRAVALD